MKADEDALKLSDAQRRITDKYLLEAKLNGIELSGKKKEQLIETVNQLNRSRAEFRQKGQVS
jgi:Zn-dependent oligopeptidase